MVRIGLDAQEGVYHSTSWLRVTAVYDTNIANHNPNPITQSIGKAFVSNRQ